MALVPQCEQINQLPLLNKLGKTLDNHWTFVHDWLMLVRVIKYFKTSFLHSFMNSVTRYWYKKLANFAKAAQTVDTVGFFS